jgi:hypothetical protein
MSFFIFPWIGGGRSKRVRLEEGSGKEELSVGRGGRGNEVERNTATAQQH